MTKKFKIHAGGDALVERAIRRLNKHAVKMGYSECKVLSVGKPYETRRTILAKADGEVRESSYAVQVCDVEVEMPEQFLNYAAAEWVVIGRVVSAEGQVEVMAEGNKMAVVGKATEGFNWKCVACSHPLKQAFVVEHRTDGRILAVGSECLKQYTGADGHAIVAAIEFLAVLEYKEDGEESDGSHGGSTLRVIELDEFLAVCAAIVGREGKYVKRWERDDMSYELIENPDCTRNKAVAQFIGSGTYPVVSPTDADRAKAKELIDAWLASEVPVKDGKNDEYAEQCKFLAERGWITEKTAGVAASMVKGPREPEKSYADSKHIGTLGERRDFRNLKVLMAVEREGNYGISTILKFEDSEGNVLTWFASGSRLYERGEMVSFKATVKAHDEYKGVKQTVITRAKELT